MLKNVQAVLQLIDDYVKEFSISCPKKIDNKQKLSLNGKFGFRIINIYEINNDLMGQIELINDLNLTDDKKEIKCKIHLSMIGLFKTNKGILKEDFENMLRYNGAPALYGLMRAYINAATSLAGMTPIITPLVNFVEFFKKAKEDYNEINDKLDNDEEKQKDKKTGEIKDKQKVKNEDKDNTSTEI